MSHPKYIHFHRYSFTQEEENAVLDTLRSGWITKGPKVNQFEQALSDYTGAKGTLALNSCTAGLHLALKAYDIGPGDEVITTPLTFVASANVIAHVGAQPVLADIDPLTLNISPEEVERKITKNTKAILPVHYGGQPCDMDALMAIGQKYKIPIIEDAAHAIGAEYKGTKVGAISDISVFSFYATKNITTGEGGALQTPHEEILEKVRPLSLHGLSQDAWKRYSDKGFRHYQVHAPGYKYNMTDIQAALGLVQLKKCDKFLEQRQVVVKGYKEGLEGLPLNFVGELNQIRHAYHLFPVLLDLEQLTLSRDGFIDALHQHGIGSAVHFIPIHHHPFYKGLLGDRKSELPEIEKIAPRMLSLPLYPDLDISQQNRIIEVIHQLFKTFKR